MAIAPPLAGDSRAGASRPGRRVTVGHHPACAPPTYRWVCSTPVRVNPSGVRPTHPTVGLQHSGRVDFAAAFGGPLCEPRVVIVVAAAEADVVDARSRLAAAGVADALVVAPGGRRRLVLGRVDDEWAAERLVAELRRQGLIAVVRPDAGARLA